MSNNPYTYLDSNSFWRTAVADYSPFSIKNLWHPKFKLTADSKVATYGSCFAQHIGRSLRERGYSWLITETAPEGLSKEFISKYNYELFSSRTANIYTASLLHQWLSWATGVTPPPTEIWENEGRYFDPFRPAIEPNGFQTTEELINLRNHTIDKFRESIEKADFLVFTMGLTESWFNIAGYEYPMCPGTIGGTYDPATHRFVKQDFTFILESMNQALDIAKTINPGIKFILTVSPVPLTATNSGNHVLVATMESKSVLRAVASQLVSSRKDVDYFPSYEIINSPVFGGIFFEPNKRSVHRTGVDFVMNAFFSSINSLHSDKETSINTPTSPFFEAEVGCEEAMLELNSRGVK